MKTLSLLILALSATAILANYNDWSSYHRLITDEWTQKPHPFGGVHLKRSTFEGSESIVHMPSGGLFSEDQHFQDFYASLLHKQNNRDAYFDKIQDTMLNCDSDNKPDYLKVLPLFIGNLNPNNLTFSYKAPCFQENTATLKFVDSQTVQVIHESKKPKNLDCTDGYFYSFLRSYHVEAIVLSGTHTVTFKVNAADLAQIKKTGIFMFRACDKTIDFIPDLVKSLMLFIGGLGVDPNIPFFGSNPTEKQIKDNIQFIYEATGYQWQERPKDVVVELDESLFQSGDFLAITRFDGLDQIIEYGAGTHAGHSVMILKVNGEAYVVESQAAWYWPRKNIQMNPYKQWIQWARNCDFMVTWLPMKKEWAAKFDSDAAYAWFKTIEGTPYGFHNFLFGWVDTAEHSYPPLLAPEFLAAAFSIVETLDAYAAESVFTLALNKRLNTVNLTVAELAMEAANRGMTMPDLYAIPEIDGEMYPDGLSYVCSSFVVAMWKAGGLFGNHTINAVEFTPRDLYQMIFLDPNPTVPANCKSVDPTNPYCQIMGKYRMEFPGISTVTPYDHMNENCWSLPPNYDRIPAGC